MKKNIEAWEFAEADGLGVSTKCTREEAHAAMRRLETENDSAEAAAKIRLEDVVPERLYKHRHCDLGTIGSTECYDCGEPHLSNGRLIWVWHRV
jgi:hypothetical protein